jgi:flagellar FliJ protein
VKKFNFRLQKVLEYRGVMEDGRLRAFAKAVQVFQRRRDELTRLADELAVYRTRLAAMGVGRLCTRELALYRSYLSHCEIQVARAAEWMREAALAMEASRRELVTARREKRVIERLKEIKRRQYDYEAARDQTKELDEVAVTGFLARRVEAAAAVEAAGSNAAPEAGFAPAGEGSET